MKSPEPQQSSASASRPAHTAELALTYAAAITAGLAFIAMVTLLIAPLLGVDFAVGPTALWPVIMAVAYYGFPLALICVVALLIIHVSLNRRYEHADDDSTNRAV